MLVMMVSQADLPLKVVHTFQRRLKAVRRDRLAACLQVATSFAWHSALHVIMPNAVKVIHIMVGSRAANPVLFLGWLGLHCCLSRGCLPFLYLH